MFNLFASNLLFIYFSYPEWQRVSSYDQLSSLLSAGHHDTASSSLLSSHSRPSSSKPSSFSRSHSRTRLSEAAPDITNLPIPSFFNKTNPMQFLDIMKGVSARLDENAGVRPRKDLNSGAAFSSSSQTRKRTRGLSFGGTTELQSGKTGRGTLKKGRIDELRTRDEGKGKERAASEDEGLDSEVRGRGLQAHSSLPDMHSRSDLKRNLSSKGVDFMDVDNKDDDIDAPHVWQSAVSPSSDDDGYPRTVSQTEMPPPPLPFAHKQRHPAAADPPPTLTPLADSQHSNSINKPQTLYLPPQQPPTNYPIKQRKPDAVPKMHPLLSHKPVTTKVSSSPKMTSTPQAQPQPQHLFTPKPMSEGVNLKPTSSPCMPLFSSTSSSRPPPLGMRRNHTFPSRTPSSSSVRQDSSLTSSCGQIPHRQKGFKPPLLSLSQPQAGTQSQTRDPPRVKADTDNNVIVVEPGTSTIATIKKEASSQNLSEAPSSNTSMVLQSSTSSFSDSSASFHSATSSVSSHPQSHSQDDTPDCSRLDDCNLGMTEHVAPGPPDGDTDSSFGDMSFDMDALEETMKMYD